MKAIIPAKDNSLRIPHKNYIPFYDGKSLVDITIEKLLAVFSPEDIYLSCENEKRKSVCDKWGINFLNREAALTDNDANFKEWINRDCDKISGEEDIAWCQVIDPLFNSYSDCINQWAKVRENHDSLVAVYPQKHYFLDANYKPQGFGFGAWHVKSQDLPLSFQFTFTFSILKRSCIRNIGYHVGSNPYWYHANNKAIDIDTEADFTLAQHVYAHMRNIE